MNVLFLCVANSARSQLAHGLAQSLFGSKAHIQSAGSQPSQLNPYAVRVMQEIGIDISHHFSKSIDELPPEFIAHLDFVITLCAEEVCPIMLSRATKLHWPLFDPAGKDLSDEEKMKYFRETRDLIQQKLQEFGRQQGLI